MRCILEFSHLAYSIKYNTIGQQNLLLCHSFLSRQKKILNNFCLSSNPKCWIRLKNLKLSAFFVYSRIFHISALFWFLQAVYELNKTVLILQIVIWHHRMLSCNLVASSVALSGKKLGDLCVIIEYDACMYVALHTGKGVLVTDLFNH